MSNTTSTSVPTIEMSKKSKTKPTINFIKILVDDVVDTLKTAVKFIFGLAAIFTPGILIPMYYHGYSHITYDKFPEILVTSLFYTLAFWAGSAALVGAVIVIGGSTQDYFKSVLARSKEIS